MARKNIEGIPIHVGTELERPQDGKKYQIRTKAKTYLFKTAKQARDFYNKNIKKGSGAQIKDVGANSQKNFKNFLKIQRYINVTTKDH